MILTLNGIPGLRECIGKPLASDPITVDQAMIDRFAETTHDRQWIHNDVERATRENGHTIAHGMLTLSLIVPFANTVYVVDEPVAINYGFDKVRFPATVPVDSELTATFTITRVDAGPRVTKVLHEVAMTAKGHSTPVCVANWWTFYPTLTTEPK
jgi:acyl dehydratase